MNEFGEKAGASAVWGAMRRGAISLGRAVARACRSVDPDLRRHVYQLPLAALSLLVPRPQAIEALPPDGYRPVVFVHGLGGHPGNFVALKSYLRSRGRTRSYTVDFSGAASLRSMADHLGTVLDQVIARNELSNGQQLDVVAHSMGGLITRLVLDDEVRRSRVANVVTLGTPHDGSHLARLASTEVMRELRPGSKTLTRLQTQDFWGSPESPLLTAFWSRADTIVLPAESAQFPRGRTVEVQGVTHYGYLFNPLVTQEVWRALVA